MWRKHFGAGLDKYWIRIQELQPNIPEAIRRQRIVVIVDFTIYGLASLERAVELSSASNSLFAFDRAIENLIDMVTAALGTYPSASTLHALSKEQR